jgi:hyperosmotically inducible protein
MVRTVVLACSLTAVLAGPALAQVERRDLQVSSDIARQVSRYPDFTVFDDVNVEVEKGTVTLTGKVTMPYKRTDIERRVSRVAGVDTVKNQIEVLPASISDDALRYRIARAIYGNQMFWKYATMPNPPIHIVVDRGRVTLTGVVHNDVERALARSLASSVFGSFSVENQLRTDTEVRAAREAARDAAPRE